MGKGVWFRIFQNKKKSQSKKIWLKKGNDFIYAELSLFFLFSFYIEPLSHFPNLKIKNIPSILSF